MIEGPLNLSLYISTNTSVHGNSSHNYMNMNFIYKPLQSDPIAKPLSHFPVLGVLEVLEALEVQHA